MLTSAESRKPSTVDRDLTGSAARRAARRVSVASRPRSAPARNGSSAATTSAGVANRSAGFLASSRSTSSDNASGTSCLRWRTVVGCSVAWATIFLAAVPYSGSAKGARPQSSS